MYTLYKVYYALKYIILIKNLCIYIKSCCNLPLALNTSPQYDKKIGVTNVTPITIVIFIII